jgi:hypothetical protein
VALRTVEMHLASAYRKLNRLGRLKIVDEAVCISSAEADAVMKAELDKLGTDRFSGTRRARAGEAAVP